MQRKKFLILFLIFVFLIILILKNVLSSQTKKSRAEVKGARTSITKIPTLTPTLTTTPSSTPTPTPTATPSPTITPTIVPPQDLDGLFTKYSNQYSVNKELLKKIANCESGLNPNASTNRYAGLFQFTESLWVQTRTLMGQNSDVNLRFNAEESMKTAAFLISRGNLGIWPNCSK